MAKQQKTNPNANFNWENSQLETGERKSSDWQSELQAVLHRFDQEYRGESFTLPEAVEAMPIFQEWAGRSLQAKIASPFWQISKPQKNYRCLDIGCGFSFLIYPWREWEAFFYGQDISSLVRDTLNSRGPQLNSKLFKGVKIGPAHQLKYEDDQFDLAIATGFSCYYPRQYWLEVMAEAKRVLKSGAFVFDVLNPDAALAENWAILETYLGAEVFLDSLSDWEETIAAAGAQIMSQQPGELFHLYKVRWIARS